MDTIFFLILNIALIYGLTRLFLHVRFVIQKQKLFEYRTPYSRTCRKCKALQNMYSYSWGGRSWWEEMYPIGNDPHCECHQFSEHHPLW